MVSVQGLKPAFTADNEPPVTPPWQGRPPHQPPLVPSRHRGQPQKVAAESSIVTLPKRKKVTFKRMIYTLEKKTQRERLRSSLDSTQFRIRN